MVGKFFTCHKPGVKGQRMKSFNRKEIFPTTGMARTLGTRESAPSERFSNKFMARFDAVSCVLEARAE
jgi:hypothetical protein